MSATDLDRQLHASVLKREAWKEREAAEEKAKHEEEVHMQFGTSDMTKEELKKIVDGDRRLYYRTEELNDKLYIHYKGWKTLQNLEGWTGLKALYAECNAFDRITGLQNCRSLRSLFLQENCIKRIDGLECCPDLWNLNLNSNFIERIDGLSHMRKLNTLTIAKNKLGLGGLDDVAHLVSTTISTLDMQDNRIDDPDVVPEVLIRMQDLRVLYLKGNPCCKKIVNYRKGITANCKDLRYLDDRPVFEEDRRAAEAFNRGGLEEERAERRRIREENTQKHERNMKAFQDMVEKARSEKRERTAMRGEDKFTDETDPVESLERRLKRQTDEWKDKNASELKDDAKERAEKCMAEERRAVPGAMKATADATEEEPRRRLEEAADPEEEDEEEETEKEEKEEVATADTEADAAPLKDDFDEEMRRMYSDEDGNDSDQRKLAKDSPAEDLKKVEVDNRKLVYEDIWGEPLPVSPLSDVVGADGKSRERPPEAAPFLPWAVGDDVAGLDAMPPPSAKVVERREAALRTAVAERKSQPQGSAVEASAGGPKERGSWHDVYRQKCERLQAARVAAEEQARAGLPSSVGPAVLPADDAVKHVPAPPATGPRLAGEQLASAATPASVLHRSHICSDLDEMD